MREKTPQRPPGGGPVPGRLSRPGTAGRTVPGRSLEGCPRALTPLFLYATAGGRRRTCPSSPDRRCAGGLRRRSNPRQPQYAPGAAVPALPGARAPLRSTGSAVSASPIAWAPYSYCSALDARRDTGGGRTLARRGLSPRTRRRAVPGAITLAVSGGTHATDNRLGKRLSCGPSAPLRYR
jgi:hypothetical protein